MPRARINETSEDVVIKKPRAVRKPRVASDDSVAISPTRRRVVAKRVSVTEESGVIRKAPTAVASQRRRRVKNTKLFFSVIFVCLILSGIGISIGFFDKGAIDVVAVVNERNEKINKGEIRDESGETITKTVEVQNGDARPNGGLILGDAPAPSPDPVPEEINATTTSDNESASSSEPTAQTEVDSSVEQTEQTEQATS